MYYCVNLGHPLTCPYHGSAGRLRLGGLPNSRPSQVTVTLGERSTVCTPEFTHTHTVQACTGIGSYADVRCILAGPYRQDSNHRLPARREGCACGRISPGDFCSAGSGGQHITLRVQVAPVDRAVQIAVELTQSAGLHELDCPRIPV